MKVHPLQTIVTTLLLLNSGTVYGNLISDECPDAGSADSPLITNYISADNRINGSTICRMQYLMPEDATLWQGMLAARQQHPENFTFDASLNQQYGHFITTVNGVTAAPGYFWALFDGNGVASNFGVDSVYPVDGASYIWNYQYYDSSGNSSHTIPNYTGPCLNAAPIPASMPLTYAVAYVSISSENTDPFVNDTDFKPVCRQPVLFDSSNSSLSDILFAATQQVPLLISATIENTMVTSLNTLPNQDGLVWTPYNATSNAMLPLDLSMTDLTNMDHVIFRFTEDQMTPRGSATSTRMSSLLALVIPVFALFYASV